MPELLTQIDHFSPILNSVETARAARFRFDEHRNRFIVSRAVLRLILSLYTNIAAVDIEFTQGQRGKPYLVNNPLNLQFNVSHSHDMAVYAVTTQAEIGIDIEKIEATFSEGVAERFFSKKEYAELMQLPESERIVAFYHLWAGKEAVIKALGEGLYAPLSDFSLNLRESSQTIKLTHQQKEYLYYLEYFFADQSYQAAFVTEQPIETIQYWQWDVAGPILLPVKNHRKHK